MDLLNIRNLVTSKSSVFVFTFILFIEAKIHLVIHPVATSVAVLLSLVLISILKVVDNILNTLVKSLDLNLPYLLLHAPSRILCRNTIRLMGHGTFIAIAIDIDIESYSRTLTTLGWLHFPH